uniref:Uncharacterized protein n=1 Tax=Opuntia streptacantha TaxID=393608 RepID=A0A7C9D4B4_OPUST
MLMLTYTNQTPTTSPSLVDPLRVSFSAILSSFSLCFFHAFFSLSVSLTTLSIHRSIISISPYLWLQKSKSFFLPSTISSKKSSSWLIIFSAPDRRTPKQPFKFSTLSLIPTSDSHSTLSPPLLSNSALSSSMAVFDLRNS